MIKEPGMMNVHRVKTIAYQSVFGVAKSGMHMPMSLYSRYGATLKNGGIVERMATNQPQPKP